MYKVVLADDEPYVIEGLKIMFDWESSGFEIADTAADGGEAYEKIMSQNPDVAVIDIRMPVLDGLELTRKLRESGYNGGIIILTAYAELSYAREGLKYGVKYFLEKPVDNDEMRAALADFKTDLDSRGRTEKIIGGRHERKGAKDASYNRWCVMSVRLNEPSSVFELPEGVSLYEHNLGVQSYVIGDGENIESCAEEFFETVLKSCPNVTACAAYCDSTEEIRHCRNMAFDSLVRLVKPEKGRLYAASEHGSAEIGAAKFSGLAAELTEHIEFGDSEAAQKCLDAFFDIIEQSNEPTVYAQMLYSYIRHYADKVAAGYGSENGKTAEKDEIMVGLSDYYTRILGICSSLTRLLAETKNGGEERIFDIVERYLREHFREDIVIKDIAAMLYASPGYLGALFTKEMGMSIKDYIHSLRMKEAERLMRATDKTISEIAYEVGYNNYNHFYMQFERRFGMTPAEYRKKIK